MIRHDRPARALAISLSTLAGYVDAIGFIASGGFFVSFMSGNSTRLAVGLVDPAVNAAIAAALIGTFVLGVAAGSVLGHVARHRRRPVILTLIATLLALAALSAQFGQIPMATFVLAFTMGAENAVFERDGETRVGLTYMTGSLVRLGHGLAGILIGQRRPGWGAYALLWLGLTIGAIAGALAYSHLRDMAIWLASGAAFALAFLARNMTDGEAA